MAADLIKITDTQAWLIKAQRDLLAAEQLVAQTNPLLDAVELLDQCLTIDATLAILEETAVFLTPFVSEFRYPGTLIEPSSHEEALDRARTSLVELIKRLPEEVAPHTK